MAEWFAIASGLIVLLGAPFYLIDIFKGKTKPERTTWFIWSVLGIIAFISQYKLGAHWSLVYVGLEAIGNLVIYGLSLKFGVGGWSISDKIALVVAAFGLTLAFLMHSPLVALWGVIVADLAGAVLTIHKAYQEPSSETSITWIFLGMSSALAGLAVGKLSFQLLLYPLYLSAITFAVPIAQGLGVLKNRRTTSSISR